MPFGISTVDGEVWTPGSFGLSGVYDHWTGITDYTAKLYNSA